MFQGSFRDRAAAGRKGRPALNHGTTTGYGYHGCRCDPCRAANAAQARERYQRRNTTPAEKRRLPLRERLYGRILIGGDTDCWTWTGEHDELGYGKVSVRGKRVGAYRAVYEWFVRPVPDGLELDHLCRNRGCVNPRHLEPVTHQENMLRGYGASGINARKTRCVNGHELNEDNTYYNAKRNTRTCRTCRAAKQRELYRLRYRKASGRWREVRGKRKSA